MNQPDTKQLKRCRYCVSFKMSNLADHGFCELAVKSIDRAKLLHSDAVCIFEKNKTMTPCDGGN